MAVEVYKVARLVDGDRRISAILPPHLAFTYIDSAGRHRTAPTSMAFSSLDLALEWHEGWSPGGAYGEILGLEVWLATAASSRLISHVIGGVMDVDGDEVIQDIRFIPERVISRRRWTEVSSEVISPELHTACSPNWTPELWPFNWATLDECPRGTVLCTHLRLEGLEPRR